PEQRVGDLVAHDGDEAFWGGLFGGCDVVRAVSGDEESRDLRFEWCGKNTEWSSAGFREVVQEVLKVTTGGQDLFGRPQRSCDLWRSPSVADHRESRWVVTRSLTASATLSEERPVGGEDTY